ncbi:MAG: uncharacterized membrane protein YhaH (DUF805 family) [Gammaproteobacteria bacterium]|jgi:uncharacterized membrane protein YhaH (DUF805 family)
MPPLTKQFVRHMTPATLVLFSTLAFAVSPFVTPGFGGFSADQLPVPQIDPPVQPSGYAFAIWGVIYLWLIAGAVFGALRAGDDPDWRAMRGPLTISLIIGCFWIAAAYYEPILATVMIVIMAATAIAAMQRAGDKQPSMQVRPVALYAGWLTAASGVAIGVMLGGYAVLTSQTAAIICLVGVFIVALAVQSRRPREWGYPAAIVWALIGVIAANLSTSNWPVVILALLGAAALTLRTILSVMKEEIS